MNDSNLRKFPLALILTVGLFALWGFGHRLHDVLVPSFAKIFAFDGLQLVLTQRVQNIVYFLCAIPAALYARKFGYRAAIFFGLGCYGIGSFLFYPAGERHAFALFTSAAALISGGWIFLEVAANPLIVKFGSRETAAVRLNFAQAFYPVGCLLAVYVGQWLVQSNLAVPLWRLAHTIVVPYIAIGAAVLLLATIFDLVPFPPVATERFKHGQGLVREFRTLMSRPRFILAMFAAFAAIGAPSGTQGVVAQFAGNPTEISILAGYDLVVLSLIAYACGRAVGTGFMYWFDSDRILAVFAGAGVVACFVAMVFGGLLGVICLLLTVFFVGIAFPTVLANTIRDLGPLTQTGTAILYMGGALGFTILPLMHLLSARSSIGFALLLPALCFATILWFAMASRSASKHTPTEYAI